jgi:hypothetical protein
MIRSPVRLPVLLLVAAAAALLPEVLSAQMSVKRTEIAPAGADAAFRQALNGDLHDIFAAQARHHREHGRFAASLGELGGLETATPTISLAAGTDWYVALAGDAERGIVQHVVTMEAQQERGGPGEEAPGA